MNGSHFKKKFISLENIPMIKLIIIIINNKIQLFRENMNLNHTYKIIKIKI